MLHFVFRITLCCQIFLLSLWIWIKHTLSPLWYIANPWSTWLNNNIWFFLIFLSLAYSNSSVQSIIEQFLFPWACPCCWKPHYTGVVLPRFFLKYYDHSYTATQDNENLSEICGLTELVSIGDELIIKVCFKILHKIILSIIAENA